MPTDHQANILCEAVNQIEESRARVGVAGHHQTLRPTETHTRDETALCLKHSALSHISYNDNSQTEKMPLMPPTHEPFLLTVGAETSTDANQMKSGGLQSKYVKRYKI